MQITVAKTQFSGTANGVDWEIDLAAVPQDRLADMVEGWIEQGMTIILQRAKAGGSASERRAATKDILVRFQDGTYSFGRGAGGPRLTEEQQAELDVLRQWAMANSGWSKTVAEKEIKWKTREDQWSNVVRVALIANMTEAGWSADQIKAADLASLVADPDNRAAVKSAFAEAIAERAAVLKAAAAPVAKSGIAGLKLG